MSWHCSQELVEAFSQANIWVTGSCVRWKKIRIAERSCFDGKKTKASPSSPSGTMLTPSTGTPGMALSMSFLLGSHAKDSPLQESKREQTIPETSGQPQQGLSEKLAQGELFSKTYQESESTSESWPETLPIWGMIVNGELLPLEKPELDILGNDGGAWPTPQARDWKSGHGPRYVNKERSNDLNDAVDYNENYNPMWPTPRAANPGSRVNGKGGKILNEEVMIKEGLRNRGEYSNKAGWPTPNAHEPRLGYQDRSKGKKGSQKSLTTIVVDDNGGPEKGTRLNPDWVEWLMGWPIGWTSLDCINIDNKGWWRYCMSVEPARYWEQDPADIPVGDKYHTPRLTSKKENRAQRLKCCGNGQVPQQLLLAMKVLIQESALIDG